MFARIYGEPCEYKFVYDYGRFMVEPGRLERIEVSDLRRMFLPKLTREGKKALDNRHFVHSQLMHYGVTFEEREFTGNGTTLLKKALQSGKFDKVPEHILELQEKLHAEFLDKFDLAELSEHPDWAMDKYFLTSGRPDRTKTTTIVGISLPLSSEYRSQNMIDAASKVPGLHHKKALGPQSQTIYMGWDAEGVDEAAKGHASKDTKAMKEKAKERDQAREKRQQARDKMHTDYLKTLTRQKGKKKASNKVSPVGSYIVDSATFEDYFADGRTTELSLDIHETDTPGIFQIDFDFGVLEGIMMICADEETLEEYCSEEADSSDSQDEDEGDTDSETSKRGSKRKASGSKVSTKTKKRKGGKPPSREYFLKLKCRELEGQVHYEARDGSIDFDDTRLVSFEGEADFPSVGTGVSFSARKISDKPSPSGSEWADYSERQYEYERVNRWH
jgi:hypothetical protein